MRTQLCLHTGSLTKTSIKPLITQTETATSPPLVSMDTKGDRPPPPRGGQGQSQPWPIIGGDVTQVRFIPVQVIAVSCAR